MKAAAKTLMLVIFCQSNNGSKCAPSPFPKKKPKTMIANNAPIFSVVKTFCIQVPCRTPRQCNPDKSSTTAIENIMPRVGLIGISGSGNEKSTSCETRRGKKKDTKPMKNTARKAIAPENVTRNDDQPDKKPINLPYASR